MGQKRGKKVSRIPQGGSDMEEIKEGKKVRRNFTPVQVIHGHF
jgi:hypothetical protein